MSELIEPSKKRPGFSHILFELTICIILPTLILKKLSGDEHLGTVWSLVLALMLPLSYGIYHFIKEKKPGLVPILGFVGILLTGGIALLKLPPEYIAIKEAAIPLIIGLATLITLKTRRPLVKLFLYNDMIMQVDKIDATLAANGKTEEFEATLKNSTFILAFSFLVSSILNYTLAKIIVTSPAGTVEFNDQLGTMNLLSYPVIVIPCMIIMFVAIFYLLNRITKMTGMELEDIMHKV